MADQKKKNEIEEILSQADNLLRQIFVSDEDVFKLGQARGLIGDAYKAAGKLKFISEEKIPGEK